VVDRLEVRLDGEVVASLKRHGSAVSCTYRDEVIEEIPGGVPLLSCSLPVRSGAHDATGWCRGLLPEGQHLAVLAAAADVAASDTIGLLARYGRDIAGAFEIVAEEPPPRVPSIELYRDDSLAAEVAGLAITPLAVHDDSELSIAGLQDKLVVVATPSGWARPLHGYPSTHIIKLEPVDVVGIAAAEAACLALARAVGLTTVDARLEEIAGRPALVVSRFDRGVSSDGIAHRVHQEDLLQALGIRPEAGRGRAKYQHPGTPGPPSWWHLADLLDRFADDAHAETIQLLRAVVFTTVIANADAHAKNLALLHRTRGSVELAPLYDTVPTALWPRLRTDAAMSVGDRWPMAETTIADLLIEAKRWRLGEEEARTVIESTSVDLAAHVDDLASSDVAELVAGNTRRLLDGLARSGG